MYIFMYSYIIYVWPIVPCSSRLVEEEASLWCLPSSTQLHAAPQAQVPSTDPAPAELATESLESVSGDRSRILDILSSMEHGAAGIRRPAICDRTHVHEWPRSMTILLSKGVCCEWVQDL